MHKYKCCVTPSDELVAYVTDMERPDHEELFALVMTNAQEQKISVLLDRDKATALQFQLTQFLSQRYETVSPLLVQHEAAKQEREAIAAITKDMTPKQLRRFCLENGFALPKED